MGVFEAVCGEYIYDACVLLLWLFFSFYLSILTFSAPEPRHEKTCLRSFRPGKIQTELLSYRRNLES